MSGFGCVRLSAILKMLKSCAPGRIITEGKHKLVVRYNDLIYHNLQKGDHGEHDPELQLGGIRQMVRHLKLDPKCVKRFLPQLRI